MQDQFLNPIYLSAHQLVDLFNNSQKEIKFGDESKIVSKSNLDSPPEQTQEFSFSELQQINSNRSIPDNNVDTANIIVTKEQYALIISQIELNKKLNQQYHQLLKENQEQLQKRKQLEDENAEMLDSNFQIKREIQEIKQKLFITQSALQLRKDKQIIELKTQLKEWQHKLSEKRDTLQSTTFTENSTVESEKSNSQYCNIIKSHYVFSIQADWSESIKVPHITNLSNPTRVETILQSNQSRTDSVVNFDKQNYIVFVFNKDVFQTLYKQFPHSYEYFISLKKAQLVK